MNVTNSMNVTKPKEANPSSYHSSHPQVTVAVISYNGKEILQRCLDSIYSQTYQNICVCLVDNASTDGTADWVKAHYPNVELLSYPENKGPNPARNFAIKNSLNSLVMLVDDDAVLENDCVSALIEAFQKYPHAAVWSPRIVYHSRPDLIQFEGAYLYYLAEAVLLNDDIPIDEGLQSITPIQIAGGVAYLVSKQAATAVGFFDEDYFFGKTDGEFTFRLTQAGYDIYAVPQAICYHRVKARGLSKVYYQVRNRWYLILQTYAWKTIILITPALLVYELSLVLFLLIKGKIGEYLRAITSVIRDLPIVLKKRQYTQNLRKISDKELLHTGLINVRKDLLKNPLVMFAKSQLNTFFNMYWKLIYPLL